MNTHATYTTLGNGTRVYEEGFKACPCPLHRGMILPLSAFGFRMMKPGVIRVQSWCKAGRAL